jgi:hypothetical protein
MLLHTLRIVIDYGKVLVLNFQETDRPPNIFLESIKRTLISFSVPYNVLRR